MNKQLTQCVKNFLPKLSLTEVVHSMIKFNNSNLFNYLNVEQLIGPNPVRSFQLNFQKIIEENPKAINLALGVPSDPTSQAIIDSKYKTVQISGEAGKNGYGDPAGLLSLRKLIADSYLQKWNIPKYLYFNESNVAILTGGSSNALSISFELLCKKQQQNEIIVLSPYFGPYQGMIKLAGGNPVEVQTKEGFQPDIVNIEKAITSFTRGILINSPNNPTGKVYQESVLKNLVSLARKYKIALISDEIYEIFTYHQDKPFYSLLNYCSPNSNDNELIIVCQGPSKMLSMIGDRIGALLSNNKSFVKQITQCMGYRVASPPQLPQLAWESAFYQKEEILNYQKDLVLKYKKKGDFIINKLNQIGFNTQGEIEGGMFVMADAKKITSMDGNQLSQFFISQDVPIGIIPGSFFGKGFDEYLRFSLCPSQETLEIGFNYVEKYMKNIQK